jgi:hypothetical protein
MPFQMDQYMALSKKDLMIHITLNELYNTHSLILQHIETLVGYFLSRFYGSDFVAVSK